MVLDTIYSQLALLSESGSVLLAFDIFGTLSKAIQARVGVFARGCTHCEIWPVVDRVHHADTKTHDIRIVLYETKAMYLQISHVQCFRKIFRVNNGPGKLLVGCV